MSPSPANSFWLPLHALLLLACLVGASLLPALRIWPWCWLAPLAAYALLVLALPPLRCTFPRWRLGKITRAAILATLLIAAVSSATLIVFQSFTHPDVYGYSQLLPVASFGGILPFAIFFSVLNAVCEEVIFRGILFDALASLWGPRTAAFFTALLFGYGHLQGYPPGPPGAVLAGLFGLALGGLRIVTSGLALPIFAHIAADATIITLLARAGAF